MGWNAPFRHRQAAPSAARGSVPKAKKSSFFRKLTALAKRKILPPNTPTTGAATPSRLNPVADAAPQAPLVVQVEARFPGSSVLPEPCTFTYEYYSSAGFEPTDRLCKGLVRRIEHCSREIITRRDGKALLPERRRGQVSSTKPLRFELHFRILRRDGGVWYDTVFCSYQRQDMTRATTGQVILAAHRIVGLYMCRHDPGFKWSELPPGAPSNLFAPQTPGGELARALVGNTIPLSCIPEARFLDASQSFEVVPGYTIHFSFRSHCRSRSEPDWKREISLQSLQTTPLSLGLAEDLMWRSYDCVNNALEVRRAAFFQENAAQDLRDGVNSFSLDEDALDIELRVANNLGPDYDHLRRTVRSKLGLFQHRDARDCEDFVKSVSNSLQRYRDFTDGQILALDDFDLRVLTLHGLGWYVDDPARFVIGSMQTFPRDVIEALLERVQTGIHFVLRGSDTTIHVVAHKRGHLVLDEIMVLRPHQSIRLPPSSDTPDEQMKDAVSRLKRRIQQDIDAICKDTCSIDDIPEEAAPVAATEVDSAKAMSPEPASPTPAEESGEKIPLRVVEIPDGIAFAGPESPRTPSTASITSKRRRAFPLIPSKFALPNSSASSLVSPATPRHSSDIFSIDEAKEAVQEPTEPMEPTKTTARELTEPKEPVLESVPGPVESVEPIVEPIEPIEPVEPAEPALQPIVEPVLEPVREPVPEPVMPVEPVVESVEPVFEPATEPLSEPVIEPFSEPLSEPLSTALLVPEPDTGEPEIPEPMAVSATVPAELVETERSVFTPVEPVASSSEGFATKPVVLVDITSLSPQHPTADWAPIWEESAIVEPQVTAAIQRGQVTTVITEGDKPVEEEACAAAEERDSGVEVQIDNDAEMESHIESQPEAWQTREITAAPQDDIYFEPADEGRPESPTLPRLSMMMSTADDMEQSPDWEMVPEMKMAAVEPIAAPYIERTIALPEAPAAVIESIEVTAVTAAEEHVEESAEESDEELRVSVETELPTETELTVDEATEPVEAVAIEESVETVETTTVAEVVKEVVLLPVEEPVMAAEEPIEKSVEAPVEDIVESVETEAPTATAEEVVPPAEIETAIAKAVETPVEAVVAEAPVEAPVQLAVEEVTETPVEEAGASIEEAAEAPTVSVEEVIPPVEEALLDAEEPPTQVEEVVETIEIPVVAAVELPEVEEVEEVAEPVVGDAIDRSVVETAVAVEEPVELSAEEVAEVPIEEPFPVVEELPAEVEVVERAEIAVAAAELPEAEEAMAEPVIEKAADFPVEEVAVAPAEETLPVVEAIEIPVETAAEVGEEDAEPLAEETIGSSVEPSVWEAVGPQVEEVALPAEEAESTEAVEVAETESVEVAEPVEVVDVVEVVEAAEPVEVVEPVEAVEVVEAAEPVEAPVEKTIESPIEEAVEAPMEVVVAAPSLRDEVEFTAEEVAELPVAETAELSSETVVELPEEAVEETAELSIVVPALPVEEAETEPAVELPKEVIEPIETVETVETVETAEAAEVAEPAVELSKEIIEPIEAVEAVEVADEPAIEPASENFAEPTLHEEDELAVPEEVVYEDAVCYNEPAFLEEPALCEEAEAAEESLCMEETAFEAPIICQESVVDEQEIHLPAYVPFQAPTVDKEVDSVLYSEQPAAEEVAEPVVAPVVAADVEPVAAAVADEAKATRETAEAAVDLTVDPSVEAAEESAVATSEGSDTSRPSTPSLSSGADNSRRTSMVETPSIVRTLRDVHPAIVSESDSEGERQERLSESEGDGHYASVVHDKIGGVRALLEYVPMTIPLPAKTAAASTEATESTEATATPTAAPRAQASPDAVALGIDAGSAQAAVEPMASRGPHTFAPLSPFEEAFSRTKPTLELDLFQDDESDADEEEPAPAEVADRSMDVQAEAKQEPPVVAAASDDVFAPAAVPQLVLGEPAVISRALVSEPVVDTVIESVETDELEEADSETAEATPRQSFDRAQLYRATAQALTKVPSEASGWEDVVVPTPEEYAARNSIDTMDELEVEEQGDDLSPLPQLRLPSMPTAGYVGFHETRLVEVGLRGAVMGMHAYDRTGARPTSSSSSRPYTPFDADDAVSVSTTVPPSPGTERSSARSPVRIFHRRTKSASYKAAFMGPKRAMMRTRAASHSPGPSKLLAKTAAAQAAADQEATAESQAFMPRMAMMVSQFLGRTAQ